jgi:hypothetical protein
MWAAASGANSSASDWSVTIMYGTGAAVLVPAAWVDAATTRTRIGPRPERTRFMGNPASGVRARSPKRR